MRTTHPVVMCARGAALLAGAAIAAGLLFAACSGDVLEEQGASPDAKNYCAIVGVCGLEPEFGFGECINAIVRSQITLGAFGGESAFQSKYDCVKAAGTDCARAKLCVGRVQTNDPRCSNPNLGEPFGGQARSFCDGNRITVCNESGPGSQSFSCGDDFVLQHFGGPTCVKNADASALCGFGSCADAGAAGPTCGAGTALTYCTNGVEQRTFCGAFGGLCDATAGKCTGTCESTTSVCSGTALVKVCDGGTQLPLYDCAARPGWSCRVPADPTTFGCVPKDKECEWGVYQASCVDGTKVRFCDDGKINTYDCRDSGATKCVTTKAGVNCAL